MEGESAGCERFEIGYSREGCLSCEPEGSVSDRETADGGHIDVHPLRSCKATITGYKGCQLRNPHDLQRVCVNEAAIREKEGAQLREVAE